MPEVEEPGQLVVPGGSVSLFANTRATSLGKAVRLPKASRWMPRSPYIRSSDCRRF